MAREVIQNNPSLNKILQCINDKKSFIVEAGAGSGKTRSLIDTLQYILERDSEYLEKHGKKVVCITYTNVAKDEIISRINNNTLVLVFTIHEFLWEIIRRYQEELKKAVTEYHLEESNKKLKQPIDDLESKLTNTQIIYTEYGKNYEKGKISHNEVIALSHKIFTSHSKKISRIVSNRFPYIFVDEYQDTQKEVKEILLEHLLKENIVLGFFGDSMQKIYPTGICRIENYQQYNLELITKHENYRCSKQVINLLNNIRDDIEQVPTGMNLEGKISFFHCNNSLDDEDNLQKVKHFLEKNYQWEKYKVLMLTHKGISKKLGYDNLLTLYSNPKKISFGRDKLLKRDEKFSNFLMNKIERLIFFYKNHQYGEFLRLLAKEDFRITKHSDKVNLQKQISDLEELRKTKTIGEVMDYVFNKGLLKMPSKIKDFKDRITQENTADENIVKDKNFYDSLMQIKYDEIIKIDEYIEEQTPF